MPLYYGWKPLRKPISKPIHSFSLLCQFRYSILSDFIVFLPPLVLALHLGLKPLYIVQKSVHFKLYEKGNISSLFKDCWPVLRYVDLWYILTRFFFIFQGKFMWKGCWLSRLKRLTLLLSVSMIIDPSPQIPCLSFH